MLISWITYIKLKKQCLFKNRSFKYILFFFCIFTSSNYQLHPIHYNIHSHILIPLGNLYLSHVQLKCTRNVRFYAKKVIYMVIKWAFSSVGRTHDFSALKVVKSAVDYTESALDEIRMLKSVSIPVTENNILFQVVQSCLYNI